MDNKHQEILDTLQAFSPGRISDAANLIRLLERRGIDQKDFLEAVRQKKEEQARAVDDSVSAQGQEGQGRPCRSRGKRTGQTPGCPECGVKLSLRSIPVKQGRQNRFGWQSHWICPKCLWEQYSTASVQEEYEKHVRKGEGV